MKQQFQEPRDWHGRRVPPQPETAPPPSNGAPESAASRETFPERTRKPGDVGLANELRPGIGSRKDGQDLPAGAAAAPKEATDKGKPRATPHGYEEPRPAPREQPSDSLAHEQERQTGMSGQSSGS